MKTTTTILTAGILILLVSLGLIYSLIAFFPGLMEEYYNQVFRSNSYQTDGLFYVHPFLLSAAIFCFWSISKNYFDGNLVLRALKAAVAYGLIAMVPVLWLTFSAINVSARMVTTWLAYGVIQAFVACLVFVKRDP